MIPAHKRPNLNGAGSFGRFTDQHDGGLTSGTFSGNGGKFPSFFSFPRTPADKRKIDLKYVAASQTWVTL